MKTISKFKTEKIPLLIFAAIAGLIFLSGCATLNKGLSVFDEKIEKEERSMRKHYILGPDDIINITVEQHPEWTGQYTLNPEGKIKLPGLKDMFAEGLLKEEFAADLSKYLESYINNPRVTVDIVRYESQVIYVFGEVGSPGSYPTDGKILTLRNVIIRAGLPTRYADMRRVFVISSAREGSPQKKVINMHRVMFRGELKNNIIVTPGDIVYVPTTIIGTIVNFVNSLIGPLNSFSAARTAVTP